jgi:hypothetical protein
MTSSNAHVEPDDMTPSAIPTEVALAGLMALLVAERGEREGPDRRRTEAILADAGLTHAEIATVTRTDESQVARILQQDTSNVLPAWAAVLDRARGHMAATAHR